MGFEPRWVQSPTGAITPFLRGYRHCMPFITQLGFEPIGVQPQQEASISDVAGGKVSRKINKPV